MPKANQLTIQDVKTHDTRWVVWMKIPGPETFKKIPVRLGDGRTFKGDSLLPGADGTGTAVEARKALKRLKKEKSSYEGIGIVLGWCEKYQTRLGGIDLDEVFDPETGVFHRLADDLLEKSKTYAEVSPSGTGAKLLYTFEPDDVPRIPKTIHLETKKEAHGRRQAQIDPSFNKGRFFTITEEVFEGLESRIEPVSRILSWLGEVADKYGVRRGRKKNEKNEKDEGVGFTEDPPAWFNGAWRDEIPDSVVSLAQTDPVFLKLWQEGTKPDKGGDSSGSGLDWSLAQYLAPRIPADDLPTAIAHFAHGQVSGWIQDDEPEETIRRRIWRLVRDQLARVCTQDETMARMFETWAWPSYRWNRSTKTWFHWDGSRWADNVAGLGHIREFMEQVRQDRHRYWELIGKDGVKALNKLRQKNLAANINALALSGPSTLTSFDDYDQEPLLVNTPEGFFDVEAFKMGDPLALRMCTKRTVCAPDWRKESRTWRKLVLSMCQGDKEQASFLQRVAGVMLLGLSDDHTMFFIYGPSRTGKSVFVETLAKVFGTYAAPVPKKILSGQGHDEYVMSLRGLRMAMLDELGHREVWDGADIKRLSSSDEVSARPLYGKVTSFQPSHTIVVRGNDQPTILGADGAIAERMHLIPFNHVIRADKRDKNLTNTLVAQHGGEILAWALRGARAYLKDGLNPPEAIIEGSREYVAESDLVQRFIRTHLEVVDEKKTVSKNRMVRAFNKFLKSENLDTWAAQSVTRSLSGRGLKTSYDEANNRWYDFIQLRGLENIHTN